MSKHTPGPWTTYVNTIDDVVIRKINSAGYESCVIARHVHCTNARLIAAAPELLQALQGMLSLDEDHHQRGACDEDVCAEVQAARAAIAKATGAAQQSKGEA